MKKASIIVWLICLSVFVTGCSFDDIKAKLDSVVSTVIEKDQEKQQWFVVTSEMVYDAFDKSQGYINMRNMSLRGIPDFCKLLEATDYDNVRNINLANNNIQLVSQDLSCLENLVKLNLSYNQIEQVVSLWELPHLRELLLHKNEIESTQWFPDFPALERLSLAYNNLKEVTDIDHLVNLVTLELQHNNISTILWVENMKKLEQLRVEFNALQELNFIEELENLQLISAKWNNIAESIIADFETINKQLGWLKDAIGLSDTSKADSGVVVD